MEEKEKENKNKRGEKYFNPIQFGLYFNFHSWLSESFMTKVKNIIRKKEKQKKSVSIYMCVCVCVVKWRVFVFY